MPKMLRTTVFLLTIFFPVQAVAVDYQRLRLDMVQNQIERRGVTDQKVLTALKNVERHLFVSKEYQGRAYTDTPLPIEAGQTISQPYIVALMTALLELKGDETILEIGAGSGYQAAVLGEIAKKVYSIEIVEELARSAARLLQRLGYANIIVKHGDGYQGWNDHAPFDGIIVTAAPDHVPKPLKQQLAVGGRMVIPVGKFYQKLIVITRKKDRYVQEDIIPVRFVPMTGEAEEK